MNSIELLQDVLHLSDEAVFENGTTCNFCGNQPHNNGCIIEHIREHLLELKGNEQFIRPMVEPDIDFDIEESQPPFEQEPHRFNIPLRVGENHVDYGDEEVAGVPDEPSSPNIVFVPPTDYYAHGTPSGTPFITWTSNTEGQETADPLPITATRWTNESGEWRSSTAQVDPLPRRIRRAMRG